MFGQAGAVAGVRTAIERAAGADRSGGAVGSEAVVELLAARERLDALILAVVGEWDRGQGWALDGAVSPVAWLAHRTALTRPDAAALVRSARFVAAHDDTAKALDVGDVTAAHVTIAARAVKHREEHYRDHETLILDAARSMPPADFRAVKQHWRSCADAVADHREASAQVDGNHLELSRTFEGVGHLDGCFDPISLATIVRRLDEMEPPDPFDSPGRPRTLAQRRADALVRLAGGEAPPALGIDIVVGADTLAGRTPSDLRSQCCEIAGVGPVSPALVRTLACDAAIGRVVMRGRSEVLDLGRRTRLVSAALRRSLEVRDRGCVEPGCTAPAAWCDAHHIVHWVAHGPTRLDNLELRCRRHHVLQHRRDHEASHHRRE